MDLARIILYIAGSAWAVMVAGTLFRVRNRLARVHAAAWIVWAVNCAILAGMRAHIILYGSAPASYPYIYLVDAILLATVPVVVYWVLPTDGRN